MITNGKHVLVIIGSEKIQINPIIVSCNKFSQKLSALCGVKVGKKDS